MKIDPKRIESYEPGCIPIRALHEKKWGTWEVPQLDKESLIEWLKPRSIEYHKDVIGILLGHGHLGK